MPAGTPHTMDRYPHTMDRYPHIMDWYPHTMDRYPHTMDRYHHTTGRYHQTIRLGTYALTLRADTIMLRTGFQTKDRYPHTPGTGTLRAVTPSLVPCFSVEGCS